MMRKTPCSKAKKSCNCEGGYPMAVVSPKRLVGRLNPTCLRAFQGAAGLCLSRTNYNVEIEHWLLKLLEVGDTDLGRLLRHYDVDTARLNRGLTRALDQLKTGNARAPELSLKVMALMQEAWTLTSLEYNASRIRSGYLLAALLSDESLAGQVRTSVPELAKISAAQLLKEVPALIAGSAEDAEVGALPADATGPGPAAGSKTPALDQFTMNLTERARKGEIDPVIGRDFEIRQV